MVTCSGEPARARSRGLGGWNKMGLDSGQANGPVFVLDGCADAAGRSFGYDRDRIRANDHLSTAQCVADWFSVLVLSCFAVEEEMCLCHHSLVLPWPVGRPAIDYRRARQGRGLRLVSARCS